MKKKAFSNWLYWIAYQLFRGVQFILALAIFPIAYLFRNKIYNVDQENMTVENVYYKWWHPFAFLKLFFTKNEPGTDWIVGPIWFMKEKKEKYFKYDCYYKDIDGRILIETPFTILDSVKKKLVYFYISYKWNAIRNFMWNLHRSLGKEGAHGVVDASTINTPQVKFWDGINHRDNSGPYVLWWDKDMEWLPSECTYEGTFSYTVITKKRKARPGFCFVKVYNVFKWHLALEIWTGWSLDTGWIQLHFKPMFKKKLKATY